MECLEKSKSLAIHLKLMDELYHCPGLSGQVISYFLTGQIPMRDGVPMTNGTIQEQTRAILDDITTTLSQAECTRDDVVKAMVWLRERADFPGFNEVYGEYFPLEPPTRSAVVSDLLVDARVEVEVMAYRPLGDTT